MQTHPRFIAIDGPNAVGKSSVIAELRLLTRDLLFKSVFTKEPTNSRLGEFIRNNQDSFQGQSLAALVTADRYDHIEKLIRPNLDSGCIVITDRYLASSLVYQKKDGLTSNFILQLNSEILLPETYIILTADKAVIHDRLKARNRLTRFEDGYQTESELTLYEEAGTILRGLGVNVISLDNAGSTAAQTAKKIVDEIQRSVIN